MRDLVAQRRRARRRRLGRAGRPSAHVRASTTRSCAAVAVALLERGVEPGDRVAVLSANNVEWVVMFWACAVIGAACVPLNAWWKAEELEFALADSGAKVLFCDPKRWAVVARRRRRPRRPRARLRDGPRRARRSGRARRVELLAPDDPGALPDVDVARGRPARDPLHVGHHREGRRARRSPTARRWRTCRTLASPGATAAARARPRSRPEGSRPRTCSSCRSST